MDRWMDGEETDEWMSEVKDGRGEPEPWKVFPRAVTDLSTSAYFPSSFISSDQGTKRSLASGTEPRRPTHTGALEADRGC